ncbi:hypothetical protein [Streptacidiphilus monticola]|uniref:Integral membrane protein n=1 Tax=Streptacidiphilus monticola TaxID=2161674 RepID=A0ABW1FUJ8_9ACTN
MVLGLLTAAAAAAVLGLTVFDEARAHAAAAQARLRGVDAVALTSPAVTKGSDESTGTALLRWSDRSGAAHQVAASVPLWTQAGSTVRIWLDRHGQAGPGPESVSASAARAVGKGLLLLVTEAALLTMAWTGASWAVDRTAMRAWEREWQQVEPVWHQRG